MVYTELLTSRLDDACPNVFKCIITPPPPPPLNLAKSYGLVIPLL